MSRESYASLDAEPAAKPCGSMTGRERVLAHLDGREVDRFPFMPMTMQFACHQIGASYRDYCTDYRVLVRGQLETALRFDFDYVNTMSDPAREAADCGAVVRYFDEQPVALVDAEALLADKRNLLRLKVPDPLGGGRMWNGIRALALYQEEIKGEKLIEGWIEGPCAEAADLRGINAFMLDFFDDPQFVLDLFDFVLELELRFARAQIEAGAEMIGIGDAAASLIGPHFYKEFVWPYEKKMVSAIHAMGARVHLHICGNTRRSLSDMGQLGCDIVDLDTQAPLDEAREQMAPNQVLIGNINPVSIVRGGTPETIHRAIDECQRLAGSRFIVGAGCEIPLDTPPENIRALGEFARSQKPRPVVGAQRDSNFRLKVLA